MRVQKTGSRRIEFKTKTIEQKILYLTKCEEMGFDSISEMARQAFEQLIGEATWQFAGKLQTSTLCQRV